MGLNWKSVGTTLGGLTSALSSAGVSATNMPSILSQIGVLSNPDESAELAICSQILQSSGNPALVQALALKLATEQGIPQAAASLALSLTQPGIDIPTRVLQIETIIKQGG